MTRALGGRTLGLPRGRMHERAALRPAWEASGGVTHPPPIKKKTTKYIRVSGDKEKKKKIKKAKSKERVRKRCMQQEGKGKEGEKANERERTGRRTEKEREERTREKK